MFVLCVHTHTNALDGDERMGRTAVNSLLDDQNKMCYFDRLMVDFERCKNS